MVGILKGFGGAIIALAMLGGIFSYIGLHNSSTASDRQKVLTISPEDITRGAAPMPVQIVDSYL